MANWNPRANAIFASIVELPPEQWQAHLEQACAGDDQLRRQVEALLAAHAQAGNFLDRPVNPADVETVGPKTNGIDPVLGIVRYVGDYELLTELGRGGMGVVYKARQASLQRLVALKMILAGGHAGPAHLARFRTECEAIARLQHPNIVQIHEVAEHEGMPFYSMEFCPGGSLDKKLNGTPWQPVEAAHLVEILALAMHAAHTKNVIHRDLKPANVLFDADATPKITDFGLAKKLDDVGQTASGAIMGTPSYMAPEQASGTNTLIGPACDVYALGAILYELLTGRPPFRAATLADTILQVVNDEPIPPTRLQPKTPRDLETICLKCLHKAPEKRYASAAKLADDLRRFQHGQPIEARPAGWVERGWKWAKRRPTTAVLLLVSVAALLVVLVGGLWFNARLTEERNAALNQKDLADERAKTEAAAKKDAQIERDRANQQKKLAEEKTTLAQTEKARAETQLRRAEWAQYATQIERVQSAFEDNNTVLARQLLADCQWNLRGWEHRHLWTRLSSKATFVGHKLWVSSVAFSPDGRRILTGSWDKTAKVWDAATSQELFSLRGHKNIVSSVAFSPDGRRLLTGSYDGTAKVWDAATGKELFSLKGHPDSGLTCATFSPDGRLVITGSQDTTAKVWDAHKGQELFTLRGYTSSVISVAFNPDGQRILTASDDGMAKMWDTATGKELFSLKGHRNSVLTCATFSPDGRLVITGNRDTTAKVWDAHKGRELFTLNGHRDALTCVTFSPDGQRILTGSDDRTAKVWDAVKGQELFTLRGHLDQVTSVAFSPDGRRILTGSKDKTAKVWDGIQDQGISSLKGNVGQVLAMALSPDGRRLVISTGTSPKVWDAITGQALFFLQGHRSAVSSLAFSPDSRRILTGSTDMTAKVWDADTGRELFALTKFRAQVASVGFSPDGRYILTRSEGWTKVWDANSGQELFPFKGASGVLAFSPDGRHILTLTSSWNRTVKVSDADLGKELFSLKLGSGGLVAFSPDGRRILTGGNDGTMKIWDANLGKELFSLKGHTEEILCVAFSPDGRRILTGSKDKTAKLWEADKGQEIMSLKGHTGSVTGVAFSPNGQRIFTSSTDGSVKLWDADQGQEVFVLQGQTGRVASVAFSSDNRYVFARDGQDKILAWDTNTGQLLPDPPAEMPAAAGQAATSPDGHLLVRIQDRAAVVERLTDRPRDESLQQAALERLARFDADFHTARLAEAENADDVFAMAFHLDRLLRHQPWDAELLVKQAHVLVRQKQPQQAALSLTQALLRDPYVRFNDPGFLQRDKP